jgi:hypothetical protein
MNRDDIIRMAREAGWQEDMFGIGIWDSKELNVFANLVAAAEREGMAINSIHSCHSECQRPICVLVREAVAAEREECAKVLDEMAAADKLSNYYQVAALRIRERGAP